MVEPRITWRDIAGDLRAAIARGDHLPGGRLPSRSALTARYGVAPQTVVHAIDALRAEGLVVGRTGSGWYVRQPPTVVRLARTRLSRSERDAGRGTFTSDAHSGGWNPRVQVAIRVDAADDDIAAALELRPGTEVLVRDRVMFADDVAVQLATSYLPRNLTVGTAIEDEDTGPGGIYARLEEAGHTLTHFAETVRLDRAGGPEAELLDVAPGTALFRIRRIAYTATRPVEANIITAAGERYELVYELDAG
jgi:GntR family transcriptional regulator